MKRGVLRGEDGAPRGKADAFLRRFRVSFIIHGEAIGTQPPAVRSDVPQGPGHWKGASMSEVNPLDYAIKLEQDGLAFYTKAAADTTNPLGKKMFEGLAADERRHERLLRQVAEDMAIAISDDLPKQRIVTLFATLGEELRSQLDAEATDTQVIEKALEMERRAEAYFREQAAKATCDTHKALYERLAVEESQHVDILQNTHTYLNDTGHWFFWDEQSVLDGG